MYLVQFLSECVMKCSFHRSQCLPSTICKFNPIQNYIFFNPYLEVVLVDIGWPGWFGSVELARAEPNLNCASVESMTKSNQSQLGFSVASIIICKLMASE